MRGAFSASIKGLCKWGKDFLISLFDSGFLRGTSWWRYPSAYEWNKGTVLDPVMSRVILDQKKR
jgi:hypothetical protein